MKHVFVVAFACLAVSAPAQADALSERLRADAAKVRPDDFAWTRTTRAEQKSADESEGLVVVERYDPALPPAKRWTLVSRDGRTPSADDLKETSKSYGKAIVPNYGRVARYLSGTLQRMPDAGGKAVYRFAKLAPGSMTINGTDLSADATGELVVETGGPAPYVSQVHIVSTKPVRMMLVVKIDRLEATLRYRMMPDGRMVPAESSNVMTGSMMGKSGTQRSTSTFSDWRAR